MTNIVPTESFFLLSPVCFKATRWQTLAETSLEGAKQPFEI